MERFNYLFRSTKGLVLVAISLISIVTAIWGTLSGPLAEWGVKDVFVNLLGMKLDPAEREGRIVMLYHSIALAIIAIETYFITSIVPMKKNQQSNINATITIGYIMTMFFGLGFAYFGHNWAFHGLFIVGQSIVFLAGIFLISALWPWKNEHKVKDKDYAHSKKGTDLERVAFFVMAVATIGSAAFGAIAGMFFGNGFESFLAEDVIRNPHKPVLQLSVIGHLHIMLTLIAIAITLVIGRWLDFKGIYHKIAMRLMIFGTIVITLGVWSVVPFEPIAHKIIYVGSVLVMLAALMLVIFGWKKLIRDRIAEQGITNAGFFKKLGALLHDPLKFGPLWQMVFMNFTVSGVGIFMAVKLDEIFRVWPMREERITLTGHWHILSAIIATIILMYYADIAGLKGKKRKIFGWILIIFSDIAFASATIFSMKRLFVSEFAQDGTATFAMIFLEFGLAALLILVCILLLWKLFDLFKGKGVWKNEYKNPELEINRTSNYPIHINNQEFQKEG
ncbi:MAG: hypothetical protein HN704_00795 [Bacteroidetes bacterium]|jgi:hypothetical protein|nr:hypothetical protein [Bacteroidota bacterium]MBT6686096.1 hypothetical protein [Bacteroidota bacterium]MBT7142011.1 hypothetical protein [Bacteroidota bacterium]MBT7490122.1 hypothetical protein [Bacteroidota bacterium]